MEELLSEEGDKNTHIQEVRDSNRYMKRGKIASDWTSIFQRMEFRDLLNVRDILVDFEKMVLDHHWKMIDDFEHNRRKWEKTINAVKVTIEREITHQEAEMTNEFNKKEVRN